MDLHGRSMSDLIRQAFIDGYDHGCRDTKYMSLNVGGNYTEDSAWKYSNSFYVHRDVERLEEGNES